MVCAGDHRAKIMKLFSYPLRSLTVRLSLGSRLCPARGPEPAGGGGRQMLWQRGLRAPVERSGNSSGCGHLQFNPNTSAKWKSSALTCSGLWRAGSSWDGGGITGACELLQQPRGALGRQVPASDSPHPPMRVTGRLWHRAVMREARAYFKHRSGKEQRGPLQ